MGRAAVTAASLRRRIVEASAPAVDTRGTTHALPAPAERVVALRW